MKVCENCQFEFSTSIIIDGKKRNLNKRKYCLTCSPFGEKNSATFINGEKKHINRGGSHKSQKDKIQQYDLIEMQEFYNNGGTYRDVMEKFQISNSLLRYAVNEGLFKTQTTGRPSKKRGQKHTEESKRKISDARKKHLRDNPDSHPWKRNTKFLSKPCEIFKEVLTEKNIEFLAEYSPSDERHFSIDIALPDKMIALEINGNQHYNRDKTLKPYYAEREAFLQNLGWTVYQIHYIVCFDSVNINNLIDKILHSPDKVEFDYINYCSVPKPKNKKKYFCACGAEKDRQSNICLNCMIAKNKVNLARCLRPSKEELGKLIWEKPMKQIAKDYNVSDNSIKKWCKQYGITKFPGRGYWAKVAAGKIKK